jgi:hypothetical protein
MGVEMTVNQHTVTLVMRVVRFDPTLVLHPCGFSHMYAVKEVWDEQACGWLEGGGFGCK